MAIENYSNSSQRIACCRVLGLQPSATREEIKSAYKHLVCFSFLFFLAPPLANLSNSRHSTTRSTPSRFSSGIQTDKNRKKNTRRIVSSRQVHPLCNPPTYPRPNLFFVLYSQIHGAYQTLMDLITSSPPMSRDASGFTSPPSTPASKPSDFYSQSAGSASSWASSGPPSNASTPRTSTDELPTPKTSKHTRTHSKTSTDGFRRARTRTLSRVKKRYALSFSLR